MGEILNNLYNLIMEIVNSSTFYGPLFACLLIFLESIIPVLPLFVFITIIFLAYGNILGFIISYILTCLGCFFSFFMCRSILKGIFQKRVRKIKEFDKFMKHIDKISIPNLVLLIAIPFTPAFLVNIAAALSKMTFKKYALAILLGKISLVAFWGFIGTSLLESLKNPRILIVIVIMVAISYLLSKIVTKKMNI